MISIESRKRCRATAFLAALCMLVFAVPAFAEPVGRVLASSGAAQAQSAAGGLRPLAQGAVVERGDTLMTGADSNLQVRFVDDALLMVRPNSRIRVDDYRVEGGTLHSVLSLIAGGLRTLTGRIGKARRDAYTMNTPTATIGVRGTDYELRLCQGDCPAGSADGLYLGVADGGIVARNDAGEFDLSAHEAEDDTRRGPGRAVTLADFEAKALAIPNVGRARAVRSAPDETQASTQVPELHVYVNGIEWRRVDTFFNSKPDDEVFIVREGEDNKSYVQFGDGRTGRRPPSGIRNITAAYRVGQGADGELKAGTQPQNARRAASGKMQSVGRYGLIRTRQSALEKLDCPPEALTGVPCAAGGTVSGVEPGGSREKEEYLAGEDRESNGFNSAFSRGTFCSAGAPTCQFTSVIPGCVQPGTPICP